MLESPTTVHIRLRKKWMMKPYTVVRLAQLARVFTVSSELEQQLLSMTVYEHRAVDGNRVVVDVLSIIQAIHQVAPQADVQHYGDPQILLYVEKQPRKPHLLMISFVWLLLFFGSALAIINFHTDVNMKSVHQRIAELITGQAMKQPLWLQIPYSFGIGLGMMLFFNQLFRKKWNEEPNPLEVEMHLYEENVDAHIIATELRREQQ